LRASEQEISDGKNTLWSDTRLTDSATPEAIGKPGQPIGSLFKSSLVDYLLRLALQKNRNRVEGEGRGPGETPTAASLKLTGLELRIFHARPS
jgi:hypothetical protein